MTFFLQTTEGVVTAAAVYLMIGLAWNLVFNACGYMNLAMGEFFIIGAMISYKLENSWGVSSVLLVGPITVIAVGAIAFVAERALLRPLKDHGLPPLVVTIGIAMILLQVANKLSSAQAILPKAFIPGVISPGGVFIAYQDLVVWVSAAVVGAVFIFFFAATDRGRIMRACADNRIGATSLGINVPNYATAAFVAAGMLAAFAAFVITPIESVAYNSGDYIAIKAFMAVSVIGVGNNKGAVVGALLVAALEGYVSQYVSPDMGTLSVLIVFIALLCVHAVRNGPARHLHVRVRRSLAVRGSTP